MDGRKVGSGVTRYTLRRGYIIPLAIGAATAILLGVSQNGDYHPKALIYCFDHYGRDGETERVS